MLNQTIRNDIETIIQNATPDNLQMKLNLYLSQSLSALEHKFTQAEDRLCEIDGLDVDTAGGPNPFTDVYFSLNQTQNPYMGVIEAIEHLDDEVHIINHYIEDRQNHDLSDTAFLAVRTLEAQADIVTHAKNRLMHAQERVDEALMISALAI